IERVIVPQLARSYGVFFTAAELRGRKLFGAKVIPSRGAWIEIESDADDILYIRIDRKRKFAATSFLRVLGATTDSEILALADTPEQTAALEKTLAKDHAKTADDAYIEMHKRLRDGDLATAENAKEFIDSIFNEERYDLSRVGRFRFNQRFGKSLEEKALNVRTISLEDITIVLKQLITLNHTPGAMEDDIDHLGSRRVRYVGELLQQKIRVGMSQIKRNIQNRMSTIETDVTLPIQFISPKPLQARIKEFFTTNQLSQFMQQENVLTEVEHLRTLSALGPGGLNRARAGFEVRDVHPSHYGRLCSIHTPEGPNIGLILRLSMYARINEFGMIETPYVKVKNGKITKEVVYLNALEEEQYPIAHAAAIYDEEGNLLEEHIEVRHKGEPGLVSKEEVAFIDVATSQAFSIA
ncbi:MAG: DNA-directed RNA polymerase subunit beta, partial [Patescibacteria group bacterium]